MGSYIYRPFCKSYCMFIMADDYVWNIETGSENRLKKRCCVFKDNCFICANKTVICKRAVEKQPERPNTSSDSMLL